MVLFHSCGLLSVKLQFVAYLCRWQFVAVDTIINSQCGNLSGEKLSLEKR